MIWKDADNGFWIFVDDPLQHIHEIEYEKDGLDWVFKINFLLTQRK